MLIAFNKPYGVLFSGTFFVNILSAAEARLRYPA